MSTNKELILKLQADEKILNMLKLILSNEGGYQDHPNDTGNFWFSKNIGTNMGITPKTLNNAMSLGIVPRVKITKEYMMNLPREFAERIYIHLYVIPSKSYLLNEQLGKLHFDTAVLHGVRRANKFLQQALNMNGAKLVVDGCFGDKTFAAYSAEKDLEQLYKDYINLRLESYVQIVKRQPQKKVFYNGWVNRVQKFVNYN